MQRVGEVQAGLAGRESPLNCRAVFNDNVYLSQQMFNDSNCFLSAECVVAPHEPFKLKNNRLAYH
ncbi:hypothetical protein SAMN02982985_01133 [Rugamonas rubra]|uniref:Uncharacterized protein n=1 Tax=Rugamonas rubra TaxID=758825 RepID=A0A1I4JNX4_9BURK|nr:hypothetical protein SAMN02982985_01133 [Rugamonas rubra]